MSKKTAPDSLPLPYVDPPDSETAEYISKLPKKERRLRKSIKQSKRFQDFRKSKEKTNITRLRKWWANNWIAFLGLIFAFISAVPVIIQGILSILELLM